MKRIVLAVFLLSGCSVSLKPDETTKQNFEQVVKAINGISNYIEALQENGTLPKPEVLTKELEKKKKVSKK